jgi:exosortase/archaeosortase family protein
MTEVAGRRGARGLAALPGLGLAGRPARRFVIGFLASSAVLLSLYYFPYAEDGLVKRGIAGYLHAYAVISGAVLRLFERGVTVSGPDIIGRYSLRLVRTCDAMDVNILLVSAVLAWPGRWRRRLLAAAIGLACVLVVNVARICSLYYVGIFHPSSFTFVHIELWPIVMLAVAVGAFVLLVRWMQRESPGGSGSA